MKYQYKTVLMNFLLGNGDAHLKNFGVLYSKNLSVIRLSPAYDIVNTLSYIFKDKPALTINSKCWFGRNDLIKFGQKNCILSEHDAEEYYLDCVSAVKEPLTDMSAYIKPIPTLKKLETVRSNTDRNCF